MLVVTGSVTARPETLDAHFAQPGPAECMRAARELAADSTRVRILPVEPRA